VRTIALVEVDAYTLTVWWGQEVWRIRLGLVAQRLTPELARAAAKSGEYLTPGTLFVP